MIVGIKNYVIFIYGSYVRGGGTDEILILLSNHLVENFQYIVNYVDYYELIKTWTFTFFCV